MEEYESGGECCGGALCLSVRLYSRNVYGEYPNLG